jgi:hypothetical protein
MTSAQLDLTVGLDTQGTNAASYSPITQIVHLRVPP